MRAFLQLAMDNVGYEGGREITRGAERAAGRHPARRAGLSGTAMPMRASVLPQPEPGHAVLRVMRSRRRRPRG